ncbi:histone deacetylase domain-containing protein [Phthorimaea operculella]|nr:histone deacetylase domain-containing protein [Phthorimaea operculella]
MESVTALYFDIRKDQWPIVYDNRYNVSFCGLEKCHMFDAGKWGKIIKILKKMGLVSDDTIVQPREPSEEDLRIVHTRAYLKSLKWSCKVAMIAEVPLLVLLPNFLVQRGYLKPMRLQTGGTVLAGKLALERGWAINVGGGFHHCSRSKGGGFCPYADITMLIQCLMRAKKIATAMIVDLDAHQGNGYQHDFLDVEEVYIMDVYNKHICPHDRKAKRAIRRKVELKSGTEDQQYMLEVKSNVKQALEEFSPDILVFNAGTDILVGDPLGQLSVSADGVMERDQFMFEICKKNGIPIVMLTSGGYLHRAAGVIANSIANLYNMGLISLQELDES